MRKINGVNVDYDRNHEKIMSTLQESVIVNVPVARKESVFDQLVKVVYRPDERTGLPTGDLCYYVSDQVNPEVKEFILRNLQPDVSSAANTPLPKGVDDDLAFELTRQAGESLVDYRERLNRFAVENVEKAKTIYEVQKRSFQSSQDSSLATE